MELVKLQQLEVWDLKCFQHKVVQFGNYTEIRAENGKGKTSLIELTEMFFKPGGDAGLIRHGCDEGKGILSLSNGYTAEKIQRRDGYEEKAKQPDLIVKNSEGGTIKAPATYLYNLLPKDSYDPKPFLDDMDLSKRTDFVLSHLPVSFVTAEVNAAFAAKQGQFSEKIAPLADRGKPISLKEFDAIYAEKESARAQINREIEQCRATQATLEGSLPDDDSTDWSAQRDSVQTELADCEVEWEKLKGSIKLISSQERTQINGAATDEIYKAQEAAEVFIRAADSAANSFRAFAKHSDPGSDTAEHDRLRFLAEVMHKTVGVFVSNVISAKELESNRRARQSPM